MDMLLPKDVKMIIGKLQEHSYEAYAVGGCVRDTVLGKQPEDWDIATSATPLEVKSIFRRTIDTGIEHGTVTIMINKEGYEVTTYRIDGEYTDGRHPQRVEFTPDLTEDLKRRDFTINAMAYSDKDGLVDKFEGLKDLEDRNIKCVGNPIDRFTEDALRILRAIRFSAQLDFSIEGQTWKAILDLAPNLVNVSKERIFTELNKTLISEHPENIVLVFTSGLAPYISDSWSLICQKNYQELAEQMRIAANLPKKRYMRWTALMSRIKPEVATEILRELKSDFFTIDKTKVLVREIKKKLPVKKNDIRRCLADIGAELFDDLIILKENGYSYFGEDELYIKAVKKNKEEIISLGECISLKMLAIKGSDVIACGISPGPEVGRVLKYLFDSVLDKPELNKIEILIKMI